MNKYFQQALFAVIISALSSLVYLQLSSKKVAYVDSAKLVNNYQSMIEARKIYQQKSSVWKANVDTLASEVQLTISNYEKESGTMTSKEKELSQELIRTRQRQFVEYQKAINEKAAQEDNQMTSHILEQVNSYIREYGDEHGYKIIFAATEYGNIAYAEEGIDITDKVLEGLNKGYAGQ